MKLTWRAVAQAAAATASATITETPTETATVTAGSTGGAVEIARGEGNTDADGLLRVRFRARVSGLSGQGRAWAQAVRFDVRGSDDFGTIAVASRTLGALGPGAAAPSVPPEIMTTLVTPPFLRVGDRAVLRGWALNTGPLARDVTGLLDISGVEADGALRRRAVAGPGAAVRFEWPIAAAEAGQARAALTARASGHAVDRTPGQGPDRHSAGSWAVRHPGRPVGRAWTGDLAAPALVGFRIPPAAVRGTAKLSVSLTGTPASAAQVAARSLLLSDWSSRSEALAARVLAIAPLVPSGGDAWRKLAAVTVFQLARAANRDGGWGWVRGQPSRLDVTALALHALGTRLASDGQVLSRYQLSAAAKARSAAVAYLRGLEPQDPEDAALVLWALGPQASPALRERVWAKMRHLGAQGLARATTGLAAAGDPRALAALSQLDLRVRGEGGIAYWKGRLSDGAGPGTAEAEDVEATALAIGARLALDPQDNLAPPAIRWLLRARQGEAWASPRASALAIEALAAAPPIASAAGGAPRMRVAVNLDGHGERIRDVGPGAADIRFPPPPLGAGPHQIVLRPVDTPGSHVPAFAMSLRYLMPERATTPAPDAPLRLRRDYFAIPVSKLARAGGTPVQRFASARRLPGSAAGSRIPLDSVLLVRLTADAARPLSHVTIEDPIPAGAEAIALPGIHGRHLEQGRSGQAILYVPSLARGQTVFIHALRPRIPGSFQVPGPVAEAAGGQGTRARGAASRLELVR